ncbi:MAG: hypothetical protein M1834_002864 [Cirrosporium novae-zelandiae]|nr:MAG: hypothetical protein M1834_002864 [Cirrosporium novae-zelandiae]
MPSVAPVPLIPEANGVSKLQFDRIPDAIEAFRAGNFILVLDSPSRENEGDLIIAASAMTPSKMAFMIHHTSGYICAPLPSSLADALDLPPMIPPSENSDPNHTAYTVTIDADSAQTTTGISAQDRCETVRLLAEKGTRPENFRRPGHVLPLRAREGGVRERKGHTEAAVEFARLAGRGDVAVICEVVDEGEEVFSPDGKRAQERTVVGNGMLRSEGCLAFGKRWGIPVVTIEDLVGYLEEQDGKKEVTNGTN